MTGLVETYLQEQLHDRKQKLESARRTRPSSRVESLLKEIDQALERFDDGTYGLCEVCHGAIERDRLINDPLTLFCLDHLSEPERRALEQDLQMAARIQKSLLPENEVSLGAWRICYRYQPAGLVSGDYCDYLLSPDGCVYFMVGDVSGKGVPASMLTAHLHAMFRTLVSLALPLQEVVTRASRVFCESTLPTYYATLVCGRIECSSGAMEISNAGHPPALIVKRDGVSAIEATGLPLGLFANEEFGSACLTLEPGQSLLLWTDGYSEAVNAAGEDYGIERLRNVLAQNCCATASGLIEAFHADWDAFRSGFAPADDTTMLAVQRCMMH